MRRLMYAVVGFTAGWGAIWLFRDTYGRMPEKDLWLTWGVPFGLVVLAAILIGKAAGAGNRSIWRGVQIIFYSIMATAGLAGAIVMSATTASSNPAADGPAVFLGLMAALLCALICLLSVWKLTSF